MEQVYIISHDGKPIGITEEPEAMGGLSWFHSNCMAYSMDHALTHEGYSIEAAEPDCSDVSALLSAIAERIGLRAEFAFVPFSQSKNSKMESGLGEPWKSLNWSVKLSKGAAKMETHYGQGVAYCPAHGAKRWEGNRHVEARAIEIEIETGKHASSMFGGEPRASAKAIDPPSIGDVLHSLALDSNVLESGGFEDWAAELGYSTDSRKAEAIYRECVDQSLALQRMLGLRALSEIRLAARFN